MQRGSADENTDQEVMLGLLSEVEFDAQITQRSLAARLGVALGLTNAYLKRCILKGWIKVHEAPKRRFAYYLTPTGFSEKSRLTAQYLAASFSFFRTARENILRSLLGCKAAGLQRIALYGEGELAEVAALAAMELRLELIGVVAPGSNQATVAGLPVVQSADRLEDCDAILLTDIQEPQKSYDALCQIFPAEHIFCPALLRVTTSLPTEKASKAREAI